MRALLVLACLLPLLTAGDPYDAWAQGRPQEAVQPLLAEARAGGRWDVWFDAGLAAAAASDRGTAVACLAQAMRLAPERPEPREALRSLDVALPTGWGDRAGPLALPGSGWSGVILLGAAGLLLGLALTLRRGRVACLALAGMAVFVALPGQAAGWLDGRRTWLGTVRDCSALDSTGTPLRALPAGSLVEQAADGLWAGRVLVRLGDGTMAYLAHSDVTP